MEIIKTKFKDLYIIKPTIHEDSRGHFLETFNEKIFKRETGLDVNFFQDNESNSKLDVLRGLHFQKGKHAQSKLVRVVQGSVLDVVVDIRPNSHTFGEHFKIILDSIDKTQLFIPKGFAHGFLTLIANTTFSYKCDNYYNPKTECGIYPFDTKLNIDWGSKKSDIYISDKDAKLPLFNGE